MKRKVVRAKTNLHPKRHVRVQGYFRSADGLKLYYSMTGPKDAPILLFCYGIVCSTLQWKYQMAHFEEHYRVLYMDYRGHNQSESPADPASVTLEALARDLAALLTELNAPPLPVLGHSLGVNVALELTHRFPEKVAALVLASGTPRDPFETMFQHNFLQPGFEWLRKAYALAPSLMRKFWQFQAKSPLNQEFIARAGFNRNYAKREDINEYLRVTGTIDFEIFLQLLHDFTRHSSCHWLDSVKVPTLVIGGKQDLITPIQNQRIIARLVPNAEILEIAEGSHNAQMEFPDLVNARIQNFLNRVPSYKRADGAPQVKTRRK